MKKQDRFAVIVHGKYGGPDIGWLPWLKEALEKKEYNCIVPQFPPQEDAKLKDWLDVFSSLELDLQHTTFIAHARGAIALLRWIQSLPEDIQIKKVITIACNFDYQLNRVDSDVYYASPLDYKNLKHKVKQFIVIHANDDPYVPVTAGIQLSKNLKAKLVRYKTAGHFGNDRKEAPEILAEI